MFIYLNSRERREIKNKFKKKAKTKPKVSNI
jgi:hypothetical protein